MQYPFDFLFNRHHSWACISILVQEISLIHCFPESVEKLCVLKMILLILCGTNDTCTLFKFMQPAVSNCARAQGEFFLYTLIILMHSLFGLITHVNSRSTYCPICPHNIPTTSISNTFRCSYAARGWIRRLAPVSLSFATKKPRNKICTYPYTWKIGTYCACAWRRSQRK